MTTKKISSLVRYYIAFTLVLNALVTLQGHYLHEYFYGVWSGLVVLNIYILVSRTQPFLFTLLQHYFSRQETLLFSEHVTSSSRRRGSAPTPPERKEGGSKVIRKERERVTQDHLKDLPSFDKTWGPRGHGWLPHALDLHFGQRKPNGHESQSYQRTRHTPMQV